MFTIFFTSTNINAIASGWGFKKNNDHEIPEIGKYQNVIEGTNSYYVGPNEKSVYLKNSFKISFYVLFDLILYIIILGFVFILITGLYKYFIPVKINYKDVMLSSMIITIILFFMTIIYQTLIRETLIARFVNLYGNFTSLIVTFLWLYYNCYIFLVGFGLIIYKNMYK